MASKNSPDTQETQATEQTQPGPLDHLTLVQKDAVNYLLPLFGAARGRIAREDGNVEGLDVFTPFTPDRQISLVGQAKNVMSNGLRQLHTASVKARDQGANLFRLSVLDLVEAPVRGTSWWGIGIAEYNSASDAERACRAMLQSDPNAPVLLFTDFVKAVETNEETFEKGLFTDERAIKPEHIKATLKSFLGLKPQQEALPAHRANMPPRFDPRKLVLLVSTSQTGDYGVGLYANSKTPRSSRGQVSTQGMGDTSVYEEA